MEVTTQNDLPWQYASKRVVIWIKTKFVDHECLQMKLKAVLAENFLGSVHRRGTSSSVLHD
jgi:hypothetical protein